ncbi:hypothetical protein D9M69_598980 [compost metagenome]
MTSCPGLMAPDSMSGMRSRMLLTLRISAPVPSSLARTLMRTFNHRSPSMRSSPPRPSMTSLPLPPSMMLPAANSSSAVPVMPSAPAAAVPTKSRRPAMRSKLVSTLPWAPELGIESASASSPRR